MPLVDRPPRLRPASWRREGETIAAPYLPGPIEDQSYALGQAGKRDKVYRRLLVAADLVSAMFAVVLCLTVLGDDAVRPVTLLAVPLIIAVSKVKGLYDRDELLIRKTTIDDAPQLFQAATLYTLVFWLGENVFVEGTLGHPQILVLWMTLFGTGVAGRRVARSIAHHTTPAERCLFIGDAASYERLASKFDDSHINAELVGRMSLQRSARAGARGTGEQDLREILTWTEVHRIIIEPQTLPAQDMLEFVRAAKSVGVRVSLLPRVLDVVGTSVVFDDLSGLTVLGVRRFGLTRSSTLLKRTFDLVGASVALLVAAPLMAAITVAIKLDSPGPVLFRQTRVGRDGKHFSICKFRTMGVDAERRKDELRGLSDATGGLFKMLEDPRVTRAGRFLRCTSLDELPQLFNVLAGDMSMVGPRPLVVDEDQKITGFDRRRLQLTPGMTGPWQILGSARVPLQEMVKMDYLYVAGWSLWQDVKIMLRTVPYMLARKSA